MTDLPDRAQAMRTDLRRAWLLLLLTLVPVGLRVLDEDAKRLIRLATRGAIFDATAGTIFAVEHLLHCIGYLLAGLAIAQLGLKRTFGLVLLTWTALTVLGATIADPVTYRVLAPLLTSMLPGFVLISLLVSVRLAWPARQRAFTVAVLLWLFQNAFSETAGLRLIMAHAPGGEDFWRASMLVLVTLGSALFALWMLGFREHDRDGDLDLRPNPSSADGWWRILADPGVWIIIALEFCKTMVWFDSLKLRWVFADGNATAATTLALTAAMPAAFLGAAWVSDRLYQSRGDWLAARRPIIVAGFVAAATAPLLGLLSRQSGPALHILDLLALGVLQVLDLLVIDCAPRRLAGRYIGVVLTCEVVASFYLRPLIEGFATWSHGLALLVVASAVVGAGLAARLLPRLSPQEA